MKLFQKSKVARFLWTTVYIVFVMYIWGIQWHVVLGFPDPQRKRRFGDWTPKLELAITQLVFTREEYWSMILRFYKLLRLLVFQLFFF